MKKVIRANLDQLERCKEVLNKLSLEQYIHPSRAILGETIGRHFRHIIEFYLALFNEVEVLNYDDRSRNLQLETDIHFSCAQIEQIKNQLSGFSEDKNVTVEYNPFTELEDWDRADSTLKRELVYIHDHTVHHLFMIRLALENLDVILPEMEDLGINPSTLRSRACAL